MSPGAMVAPVQERGGEGAINEEEDPFCEFWRGDDARLQGELSPQSSLINDHMLLQQSTTTKFPVENLMSKSTQGISAFTPSSGS